MQHVPQFIDTRDKVAGPLTWEQLYWLGGGLGIGLVLWQLLDKFAFWFFMVPIAVAVLAFAFVRPQKLPLIAFARYAFIYFFTPRIYLWQREANIYHESSAQKKKKEADAQVMTMSKKNITTQDISSLSEVLDSHGEVSGDRIQKLLQKNAQKNVKKGLWPRRSK